jgi:hypothetical protein
VKVVKQLLLLGFKYRLSNGPCSKKPNMCQPAMTSVITEKPSGLQLFWPRNLPMGYSLCFVHLDCFVHLAAGRSPGRLTECRDGKPKVPVS